MLKSLRRFYDQYLADRDDSPPGYSEQQVRLAAAALLVEVVRSDTHFSAAERAAVLGSLQGKLGLDATQAQELVALAEAESVEAHDLFQFTSKINVTFSPERKARFLEELWRVAYADETLHAHEEYLIRRVADLLHVSHATFIATKLRVLGA
jgi:uncharacterized tellurite resistance protein B-like protein